MTIPTLKRIKISSERDLRHWLAAGPVVDGSVMLVTFNRTSPAKHVSHAEVHAALSEHGWVSERRYTLNSTLVGHVIRKEQSVVSQS